MQDILQIIIQTLQNIHLQNFYERLQILVISTELIILVLFITISLHFLTIQ